MILSLTNRQVSSLIEETKRKHPVESCGLLFGWITEEEAVVKKIAETRNVLESSSEFQINPEEFIKHISEAEREGLQLIGFYHSHPADPKPSMIDVKYMKLWPESIWLIISSIDYSMGAYQMVNEKFVKIDVKVSGSIDDSSYKKHPNQQDRNGRIPEEDTNLKIHCYLLIHPAAEDS